MSQFFFNQRTHLVSDVIDGTIIASPWNNLARLESITVLPADDKGPVSVTKIIDGAELLIPMAGLINKEDELARLAKEVAKIEGEIARIEGKLSNEGFVARAPEAVIAKEREKLDGYAEAKAKLIEQQAVIAAL